MSDTALAVLIVGVFACLVVGGLILVTRALDAPGKPGTIRSRGRHDWDVQPAPPEYEGYGFTFYWLTCRRCGEFRKNVLSTQMGHPGVTDGCSGRRDGQAG